MLQKRIERGMQWLKERRVLRDDAEEMPVEKGDVRAMIVSAMLFILPVALLALLVMVGIPLLLFLL